MIGRDIPGDILQGLNEQQAAAVEADPTRSVLVLAGAGTGKTRVLTHRFAWLVARGHAHPGEILAVTFTNKAAAEMRERIFHLLGRTPDRGLWIGTFHALCRRMLLRFHAEAGLPAQFQILDRGDQDALVRQVLGDLGRPRKRRDVRDAVSWISGIKGAGMRPRSVSPVSPFEESMLTVYEEYDKRTRRAGVTDFDELLLRALEMLRDREEIRGHYRRIFRHLLADEFQDTNELQYAWLCHLQGAGMSLFAVGDDDQSIYSWRGARPDYMLQFENNHPGSVRHTLDRNYRSTSRILDTANALIAANARRLPKRLWTEDGADPHPVQLADATDELDEADTVLAEVHRQYAATGRYRDCAVLYRTNRQSRPFESKLTRAGIPYRVYGGRRFFERQEVRDAMAYLRLVVNPDDDVAWDRARSTPRRGIGDAFLKRVRQEAAQEEGSFSRAASRLCESGARGRAVAGVRELEQVLESLRETAREAGLAQIAKAALEESGLLEMYRQSDRNLGEARLENLEELLNSVAAFEEEAERGDETGIELLSAFLDTTALDAGDALEGEEGDAVQLMTLHAAKGLEFPFVMLAGLVEGRVPLASPSEAEDADLEEERRLMYVGITRARERLLLLYPRQFRVRGEPHAMEPSRFLHDLPLEWRTEGPATPQPPGRSEVSFGEREDVPSPGAAVRHPKFGPGTILRYEGSPRNLRVQVRFEELGVKWLVYDYAKLSPLSAQG